MKPIYFVWQDGAMVPLKRSAKDCERQYVAGRVYCLEAIEDRSLASHRQFFASVKDAWLNLSHDLAEQFPTPDHLRRYALIKAGYCDQRVHPCKSKEEAHELAKFIRPIDEYALVLPFENLVTVFTAKSQSMKAMGRKDFETSKRAVLEIVSAMIGAKPEDLGKAA